MAVNNFEFSHSLFDRNLLYNISCPLARSRRCPEKVFSFLHITSNYLRGSCIMILDLSFPGGLFLC